MNIVCECCGKADFQLPDSPSYRHYVCTPCQTINKLNTELAEQKDKCRRLEDRWRDQNDIISALSRRNVRLNELLQKAESNHPRSPYKAEPFLTRDIPPRVLDLPVPPVLQRARRPR